MTRAGAARSSGTYLEGRELMSGQAKVAGNEVDELVDPRALLADWANTNEEWVRFLVSEVIASRGRLDDLTIGKIYQLLRQENALDRRTLAVVEKLDTESRQDESAPPLTLIRLSEVHGVNALVPDAVLEPHEGLTILYGENGSGKTGYSRVFKALANSRTADTILANINTDASPGQTAKLEFKLGDDEQTLIWTGGRGVSPFTRMSIFDSPAVTTHVDEDLDYVYVPASLALFHHVTAAIQAVGAEIDTSISTLGTGSSGLLARFQTGSAIYPVIEALGAPTDLDELEAKIASGEGVEKRLAALTDQVATLRTNNTGVQIATLKREKRVLMQATAAYDALQAFASSEYNEVLAKRAQLDKDYKIFRDELFAAADLPAAPDDTWSGFIVAGEDYRQHLIEIGAHDESRCLYCRQPLLQPSADLIARYSTYLEDKISTDIRVTDGLLIGIKHQITSIEIDELAAFVNECENLGDGPSYFSQITKIAGVRQIVAGAIDMGHPVDPKIAGVPTVPRADLEAALKTIEASITDLQTQLGNRTEVLEAKQTELRDLKDRVELGKSWPLIEAQVCSAKETESLKAIKRVLPSLTRAVTGLAKTASDQMINRSFDALFLEECEALRAPGLKLEFVGRGGKAQRRKIMSGRHKPSKVLSEGEQKVLALADFLAEARLAGITAPVIFDDPVSSLDHRRLREVARRIARLAQHNQVIVFTHDILFATTLLELLENSRRCAYFQISGEGGKGKVTRATGPRWDTLKGIRGKINESIQAARQHEGEAREADVRVGYGWLRSWCEVFTETELLQGVTRRYQPDIGMGRLSKINTARLDEIIPKVVEIFNEACRYIDAHSQPLATLSVGPTLSGLEEHWATLQELKEVHEGKSKGAV